MTVKRLLTITFLGVLFLTLSNGVKAQVNSAFDRGSFITKKDTLPYRILFPKGLDPRKKYPIIFVLHGAGERGNDNNAQLAYGPELFLNDTVRQKFPAIVIYPQCPKDSYWSNVLIDTNSTGKRQFHFREGGEPTRAMAALIGLVDKMLEKPYVNNKQVYIGGLSMGGMGTFEILRRKPNVFAAAFAICGGDNTNNAKRYAKKVPLWIFHGVKDSVVPYDHSVVMVAAIKEAGGDPKFTSYPDADHNSWVNAFAEPGLMPWLFSHSK
ncbi:phospholipase [Mucilaginibacter terrenus]|uniref:Phospholipase n=1 Tax=Mucilaginibacter terrenus TaxID=2482727 RepID=A0A3E2NQD8_9SPHI|nr:prolyl oligopeptidase family serine peptidase [Mucilaginibacter terrenus]RFZ83202.1 phospholipase [Mucilaginibacter terrenus]